MYPIYHYNPIEWQDYRFPPTDNYYVDEDPYYPTMYDTSSFNKHKRKSKKKRHSISEGKRKTNFA